MLPAAACKGFHVHAHWLWRELGVKTKTQRPRPSCHFIGWPLFGRSAWIQTGSSVSEWAVSVYGGQRRSHTHRANVEGRQLLQTVDWITSGLRRAFLFYIWTVNSSRIKTRYALFSFLVHFTYGWRGAGRRTESPLSEETLCVKFWRGESKKVKYSFIFKETLEDF